MKFHFYIETSPCAFSMQANDILEKIDDSNAHLFILNQTLCFTEDIKTKSNVTFVEVNRDNLVGVTVEILAAINKKTQQSIVLHFGTEQAESICEILSKSKHPKNKTSLRIYEDDPLSIITRNALIELPTVKRQNAIDTYAQNLYDKIYTKKSNLIADNGWNSVVTYCFGKIYDAKYYSCDKTRFSDNNFLITPLSVLNPDIILSAGLFNASWVEDVKDFVDSNTLFFIFKGDYTARDVQINIENIIDELKLSRPRINKLLVWGAKKTITALHGIQICYLSNDIPLILMDLCNILPMYVAGELCTEMFLLTDHKVILTLPPFDEKPLEQLTGKFSIFSDSKSISLIDNESHLSADNLRIFRCAASMGDVVFAMGALTALKTRTSEKFVLIANRLFEEMVSACPAIDYFWPVNSVTESKSKLIDAVSIRGKVHLFDKWEQILAPKHQILACLDEFNGRWNERDLQPQLDLSGLDTSRVDAFVRAHHLTKEKTVLIHPNIGSPNRTWTEDGWNAVAEHMLATGWQVVVIGTTKNNTKNRDMFTIANPDVVSAVNEFSILESIYFMQQCALLVASDSGPVALAGMTSIGIVSIYSQIEADYRLPYRNGVQGWNALGINVGCPAYGACGKYVSANLKETSTEAYSRAFAAWCPDNKSYACLRGLSGEAIIHCINLFIQSADYIPPQLCEA